MMDSCDFSSVNMRKLMTLLVVLLIVFSNVQDFNLMTTVSIIQENDPINVKIGDYLEYEVIIDTLIFSETDWRKLKDPTESDGYYEEIGLFRLEITNVTDLYIQIESSFQFATTPENGNYHINRTILFTLRGNKVYRNNTFWGYCPFFYPGSLPIKSEIGTLNQSESLVFSGVLDRSYTHVYQQKQMKSHVLSDKGVQYSTLVQTEMFYLKNNERFNAVVRYHYDNSAGIAYSITTDDPWWYIFTNDVAFRGRLTNLVDYNWDFGEGDKVAEFLYNVFSLIFNPLSIIAIPTILLIIFYLWYNKNTNRKNCNHLSNIRYKTKI